MASRSEFENRVLDRVGRSTTRLTIDDVGAVLGDAFADQRRAILAHVGRLFRLQELNAASTQSDERFKNLHRRLIQVEGEVRAIKKGGSR
jgi:hypothetical protein